MLKNGSVALKGLESEGLNGLLCNQNPENGSEEYCLSLEIKKSLGGVESQNFQRNCIQEILTYKFRLKGYPQNLCWGERCLILPIPKPLYSL